MQVCRLHLLLTLKRRHDCSANFVSFVLLILNRSTLVLVLNALMLAQTGQKTFRSPEEASRALFVAAQMDDQGAMLDIFGPDGNEIVSTGDEVEDKNERDQFVANYKKMHLLTKASDGTVDLYIGGDDSPFPVPLVNEGGTWYFDTEAGKKEILYRRVGENEYEAINSCFALVDAQNEYYSQSRDGRIRQYAQELVSDKGKHNGLFWNAGDGETESPIGPLLAHAEGMSDQKPQKYVNSPLHGYYFRILTGTNETTQGGVTSYIVNGQMTGGFAILAYPADYRSTGVMTFMVNQNGEVYEKDLGSETTVVEGAMTEFVLDDTWNRPE